MATVTKWLVLFLAPIGILSFNPPTGLTDEAWKIFAVYVSAILGIIIQPANISVVMLTVLAFGTLILPVGKLLSGFSNGTTWLVFTAFLVTQAFVDTGLGRRLAYYMIGKIGKTTLGLAYGDLITDFILSPATPSATARTGGIVYPIFQNVAMTMGSMPGESARKVGAYITIVGSIISLCTCACFSTACAPNLLTVGFANDILGLNIGWVEWAVYMAAPALVMCVLSPYIVYKIYPPEIIDIPDHKEIAQRGLEEMGPMSRQEKILVVLFVLAIVGWATSSVTKIAATSVALLFFGAAAIFRLINWQNVLSNKGAWNTFIWYGAIIGLSGILAKAGFFKWMAKAFSENFSLTGMNPLVVLVVLLIVSVVIRYIFASLGAYVGAFIPVLFTIGLLAKVPPALLFVLLASSSAYACNLTHYSSAVGAVLFGSEYVPQNTWWRIGAVITVINMICYLTIGMAYWKVLGLW